MEFKSALVTGASSGLGAALARELARGGAFVYLLARRADRLTALQGELEGPGGLAMAVDVTDATALATAIGKADQHGIERGAPLDLVIANAGVAESGLPPATAEQPAEQTAERVLQVNTLAAIRTLELGRRAMAPRGRGHLAAVSSLAGLRGMPGASAYSASKAALRAYVEGLRFDLAGEGLGITDVCPGYVRTEMTDRNSFSMPFLMEPGPAARRIVIGLRRRRRTLAFPRRLAWPLSLAVRVLPAPLLDRALAAGRSE